ncbi:MAG: 5-formyltetrahydrofolate cyclo-ligase [Nitrospirota bacterium]
MKKRLREKLLKKRDSIPHDLKAQKESEIEQKLFDLDIFKKAACLLMYVSFRSEVDTRRYLDDVLKTGKVLVLPLVDTRHKGLKLYKINATSELSPGYMGIPEPAARESRRVTIKEIDLVVIPGTGFDINGNRLGYGGGYYDRLLSYESKQLAKVEHIPTVALAFEEQIGEEIPAEPHDIQVDMIITDKRLIRCDKRKR